MHTWLNFIACVLMLTAAAGVFCLLPACATRAAAVTDPMAEIRNERLGERRRVQAIEDLWAKVEAGQMDRGSVREDLKMLAWSPAWSGSLRLAALKAVASDQTERGQEDTRQLVRLMLPTERDPAVTEFLSATAASRSWAETTPALVRSLSRQWPGTREADRPEYRSLTVLNPDRDVVDVAYEVFLTAERHADTRGIATAERIRGDAWELLGRLDRDGSRRAAMIVEADGRAGGPVADMQALLRDLRTLPLTGEELRWLAQLRDFRETGRRQWWTMTTSAVGGLDRARTGHIHMRHLEAIRWASQHRPELVSLSREELLSEAQRRLAGRQHHRRTPQRGEERIPDRLSDWQDQLSWGDLLTMLVLDEAVREPRVVESLLEQAERDRRDRSAEYGGLIRAQRGPDGIGGPTFIAVLYPPRPGDRRGDHEFVAPRDMIDQSAHALAHYHFHAQEPRNSAYAGPSPADMAYAARFGRACLVFTSVSTSALNVDYYQPDGAVIDLGTIRR